jgi:hypothetical protein
MKKLLQFLLIQAVGIWSLAYAQGKFSGYMFGDYFYNIARDTSFQGTKPPGNAAVGGQKDLQAFQFRRIYFTYDNDISEQFTTRFRLEADQSALTGNGKITTYVKDAYLTWKNIFSGSNLTFGIQPTPAYDISEAAWGYRSLEKTIMDLRGIIPSRHLGLSLRGKLDDAGMFNYWLLIANNSNSTSVPNGSSTFTDRFKRFSLLFHVKPVKNFQFTLYGDYRGLAAINDPTSTTVPRATVSNSTMTGAAFVGYNEPDKFNLGVEGFLQSQANGMKDPSSSIGALKSLSARGLTIYGLANVATDIALLARFDYFDPNTDASVTGDVRNYLIGGLVYKPHKNVSIIPNLLVETYQDLPNGHSISASVTGRVTLYYIFL